MNLQHTFLRAPRAFVLAAAFAGAATLPAFAQSSHSAPGLSPGDRALVTALLQESREQLALARLAEHRAVNPVVLSAANTTADEWSKLRARLLPIAYAQGAPVRGTLDDRQQADLESLGRAGRSRFDRAYLRDAQRGNETALERLRQDGDTSDSRVARFVSFAHTMVSSDEEMTSDDLLMHQS